MWMTFYKWESSVEIKKTIKKEPNENTKNKKHDIRSSWCVWLRWLRVIPCTIYYVNLFKR